ncbi:MAG TPA: MMPL family transporter [Acidimicrobiales bacterium]|nr:MMPL family transporter [Acidimicrobiales bacterium]
MALNFGKHAGIVGVVGLAVTLLLGLGITRLEFATGQDSYLNKDDQVYKDSVAYQDLFGGQAMVSLFTMDEGSDVVDLFSPENLERMQRVDEELRQTEGVVAVVSPLTALQFTQNLVSSDTGDVTQSVAGQALLSARERDPDPASQARRLDDAATTLARISAFTPEQQTFANPEWVRFLLYDNRDEIRKSLRPFFPDAGHAQTVTRLVGNADLEDEGVASERVMEVVGAEDWDDTQVTTTGAPVLLKDLNDYLRGGMLTLGAIAVVIMTLILLLLFRVRWRLLPLGVILVGVVWAFGLAGYLGIPLSVVTIAGLPVMLGVGIDYAIQMHSRIEEEVLVDRSPHPIQEASMGLGPALLVVTFDAVFAFLALLFARVPMIRAFGVLLAVGIAAICVCSIVLPLATLGIREYRSPTVGRDYRGGVLARLVVWLGSLPTGAAVPLAVASLVIFVGGVLVEDDLTLESDPERWVNQDSQVIADINTLRRETGSSAELGIFVESDDVFSDESVGFVHDFATEQLAERPDDLLTASSIVTTVSFLLEVPDTTVLPPTGADVRRAWEVAPADIQRSTVSADASALNLIFRTGPGSLEERAVYTGAIRDQLEERPASADASGESIDVAAGGAVVPPEGVRATPSGLAVVGVGLLENLEANRILLIYLSAGFVFLFLVVRLRSVVRALLSMVPVFIAVGAASLVAWVFALRLSPMTAVGGPLVIAACTEFTSLILLRFIEERQRGLGPREAVEATAERTGRAFIVSALTAIAGVAVIAFSTLPLLRDFGIVVAMNVAVALLSALVVLPPMLVWAEERGWVTRGLLDRGGRIEATADSKESPDVVTPRR